MSGKADAERVADDLARVAFAGPVVLQEVVKYWAFAGLGRVKSNASGRPGPRRVTGDYTRTFNVELYRTGDAVRATIGTNAVQALRLELGFVGADSLGRVYNQAPLPHWMPMADWVEQGFHADAANRIARLIA